MNKEIRDRILEQRNDLMDVRDFYNFLKHLEKEGEIELVSDCAPVKNYLSGVLENAKEVLDKRGWPWHELSLLESLNKLSVRGDDIIYEGGYDYPEKIRNNDHLLELVGLGDLAGVELEDDEN